MTKKMLVLTVVLTICLRTYSSLQGQVTNGTETGVRGIAWPRPGSEAEVLPTFDLNFGGGTAQELVSAISDELIHATKDSSKIVNVIIPKEYESTEMPAMNLRNVTVKQVFEALEKASSKVLMYQSGTQSYTSPSGQFELRPAYQTYNSSYSFQTSGPITANSVWYFVVNKPPVMQEVKVCRFYQLGPHLESGINIDDITTAIKAGYKMLDEQKMPELNFHEDTRLLIAVGSASTLKLIEDVLSQLPKVNAQGLNFTPQLNTK